MTPKEFAFPEDHYNTPHGEIQEALNNNLVIMSRNHKWIVLSYYYDEDEKCMILDIGKVI